LLYNWKKKIGRIKIILLCFSEDELPYKNTKLVILNFDDNLYYKIKSMCEIIGATIIKQTSLNTDIVIASK